MRVNVTMVITALLHYVAVVKAGSSKHLDGISVEELIIG
jgi:hypothetical protein